MRVAVIGTGAIGAPVALRLLAAGHEVAAYDRRPGRARSLADAGVEVAPGVREAVAGAEGVMLLVLDGRGVARVVEEGAGALRPGALVVDMTTSGVAEKRAFADRIRSLGARPAEAPFFGTVPEAKRGALFAVVGCEDADLEDVRALLGPICSGLYRHGGVGEASALKLAANVLVFPMVELIAEALALARAQGVEAEALLGLLEAGTGVRAPLYLARGRLIAEGDYAPRASVEMAMKDLELLAEAAAAAGLELPLLERTRAVFAEARAAGLGGRDMAAVYTLLGERRR